MADEEEKAPESAAPEAKAPSVVPPSMAPPRPGSIAPPRPASAPPPPPPPVFDDPPPVRTTSATPPPLESDPFAITGLDDPPAAVPGAISSGAFEISRASFSQAPSDDLPPSTVISNAMGRSKPGLSLGAIAGIGAAVLIVAVGLSLLLFR